MRTVKLVCSDTRYGRRKSTLQLWATRKHRRKTRGAQLISPWWPNFLLNVFEHYQSSYSTRLWARADFKELFDCSRRLKEFSDWRGRDGAKILRIKLLFLTEHHVTAIPPSSHAPLFRIMSSLSQFTFSQCTSASIFTPKQSRTEGSLEDCFPLERPLQAYRARACTQYIPVECPGQWSSQKHFILSRGTLF